MLQAFRDLSTCRAQDGPIPWTAVALYADKAELEPDNARLLWSVVQSMDIAERKWVLDSHAGRTGYEGRKKPPEEQDAGDA